MHVGSSGGIAPTTHGERDGNVSKAAIPLAVAAAVQATTGLLDIVIASRLLTADAVAGLALGASLLWVVTGFAMGAILAIDAHYPRAVMEESEEKVAISLAASVLAGLLWAGLTLVVVVGALWGLPYMGQSADVSMHANAYAGIALFGIPPLVLVVALQQVAITHERAHVVAWASAFALLANVPVAILLTRGVHPIPALGLEGIAIAAVLGEGVMFVVLCIALRKHLSPLGTLRRNAGGVVPKVLVYIKEGFSLGISYSVENISYGVMTVLVGRAGSVALAAHGLAGKVWGLIYTVPEAIGLAIGPLWGRAGSSDDQRQKRRWAWRASRPSGFVGLATLVLALPLAVLLSPWQPSRPLLAGFIMLAGVSLITDGYVYAASGILRAEGRSHRCAQISMVQAGSTIICAISFLYVAGPMGVWFAYLVGSLLASLMSRRALVEGIGS